MFKMEGCFKDMKGEGFFAPTVKKPQGKEKKKQVFVTFLWSMILLYFFVSFFRASDAIRYDHPN